MKPLLSQLESKHIMIVEDSEDDYEATRRALKKVGLLNNIHRCESGQLALNYLNNTDNPSPGLILLDLNMPGLNGKKTLEAIKTQTQLRCIPVIILTTSSDAEDIRYCYDMGANSYVQKPVNYESLIDAMQRMKDYWFETSILPKEVRRA